MLTTELDAVRRAEASGIQLSYVSAFGSVVEADPEALKAALAALGEVATPEAVSVDPVAVSWGGKGFKVQISLASEGAGGATTFDVPRGITLELKRGKRRHRIPLRFKREKQDSRGFVAHARENLPFGYHQGIVRGLGRPQTLLIISAPVRSYQLKRRKKPLGAFMPMYALHSEASLGIGDYSDLEMLSTWAAERGVDFIGTLPLLPIFTGRPLLEPSPYSPVSRLLWTELYIDPRRSPEWQSSRRAKALLASPEFQNSLARLKASRFVDYRAVAALKRELLEVLADEFEKRGSQARKREFKNFLSRNPLVERFAEFSAAGEKYGKPWQEWPAKARDGLLKPSDYRARDKRYHLYAQWLAETQLAEVSGKVNPPGARRASANGSSGAGLYLDFPLSVHASGFDVWAFRNDFARGATAGAPPDPTFMHGQDWGILPLHPLRMRQSGYKYVRHALSHHMRHAKFLRLDHVMGFYRLFWILPGLGAKRGVYVRYPMDELFAILCLESHLNLCKLIGEDLGTVPPEIREAMTRHGILRMGIQQFEINPHAATPFEGPPKNAIVSLNTHDLPLFAAFWSGADLRDQKALGYFGAAELKRRLAARERAKARLVELLRNKGLLAPRVAVTAAAVLRALLIGTARSDVAVMQLSLEDSWLETEPQNTPGTSSERANWIRKSKLVLEELMSSEEINSLLTTCARLR